MGVGPSLDGETAEAKKILADFTAGFAKNYTLLYTVALAKLQMKNAGKVYGWELMKCPWSPDTPERYKGHVLKRSNFFKKWNKRYLVIRGNWVLDFWETEEDYKAGKKPRATFNMSGYNRVDTDPNNNALEKLKGLAEKAGLDLSSLPLPEKLPDNTMVCESAGKPPLVLQTIEDNEKTAEVNFKDLSRNLERAYYQSPYLSENEDLAHVQCFRQAVWRTCWENGFWSYYCGGGEEAILTSTIARMIEWRVMGNVDAKLKMPWAVRQKVRNTFLSTVFSTCSNAVNPFWKTLYGTIKDTLRPTAEEQLAKLTGPIGEAQGELKKKIGEATGEASKGVVAEKIEPKIGQAIENLFAPVNEAFQMIVYAYDEVIKEGKEHYKPEDEKHYCLVRRYSWSWKVWGTHYKLNEMYDLLWALGLIFDEIYPWSIIYRGQRRLSKHFRNAVYTFETKLHQAGGVDHWDTVAAEVRAMLVRDCTRAVSTFGARIMVQAIEPMWEKLVITPCRMLVEPLIKLIPEPVKLFLDVNDMLVDVLYSILKSICTACFAPFANRIKIE